MNPGSATVRRHPSVPVAPAIRLLIVDDSSVARAVLSRIVGTNSGFEVAALAGTAEEALAALRTTEVDIILLDVEMPGTSGIDALPAIIAAGNGARVIIISSMAEDGAEVTIRALAQGAADTLPKPGAAGFSGRFGDVLVDRLRRIGRTTRRAPVRPQFRDLDGIRLRAMTEGKVSCVGIGASTGGLPALIEFLGALPERPGFPVLVTQHLPSVFIPYFARQLESACGRPALVAEEGSPLIDNLILVAPGDAHLRLSSEGGRVRVRLDHRSAPSRCLPSVDPMMESIADHFGEAGIGVILSGMGRDGLIGSHQLALKGGSVMAQDPASAAIWGMPRAVAEAGLACALLPPADLARRIVQRQEAVSWK